MVKNLRIEHIINGLYCLGLVFNRPWIVIASILLIILSRIHISQVLLYYLASSTLEGEFLINGISVHLLFSVFIIIKYTLQFNIINLKLHISHWVLIIILLFHAVLPQISLLDRFLFFSRVAIFFAFAFAVQGKSVLSETQNKFLNIQCLSVILSISYFIIYNSVSYESWDASSVRFGLSKTNINEVAICLVFIMLFVYQNTRSWFILLVSSVLFGYVVLISGSRTGFVVMILTLLLILPKRRLKYITVLILFLGLIVFSPDLGRISDISLDSFMEARGNRLSKELFQNSSFAQTCLGSGLDSEYYSSLGYNFDSVSHNTYVDVYYQFGVLGLVFFLLSIIHGLSSAIMRPYFLVIGITFFTLSWFWRELFWIFLAVSLNNQDYE